MWVYFQNSYDKTILNLHDCQNQWNHYPRLFNTVSIFSLCCKQSHLHGENKTAVRAIVLTWKAVIEFDSNDKITICRKFASIYWLQDSNRSKSKPFFKF